MNFCGLISARCKTDNQSIFVLTSMGEIFVSRDHGNSWKSLKDQIHLSTIGFLGLMFGGPQRGLYKFDGLIQSTSNGDHMIITSNRFQSWATTDCGLHWSLQPFLELFGFRYNPANASMIVALSRKRCGIKTKEQPNCKEFNILYRSIDGGMSWKAIENYVYQYEWGIEKTENNHPLNISSLVITKQENHQVSQPRFLNKLSSKRHKISTFYSDDFFNTSKKIANGGFEFWLTNCCIYVNKLDNRGNTVLKVSRHATKKHQWFNVRIFGTENYENFKILDDIQGYYTYLYAKRKAGSGIYVADLMSSKKDIGVNFTLAHRNMVVNDVAKIPSFEFLDSFFGLSLINVYDERMLDYFSKVDKSQKKGARAVLNLKKFILTKISFNEGMSYDLIKPPKRDSLGRSYKCKSSSCSLHLHTRENDQFPPILSDKSAPGLLIANGNVGMHLDYNVKNLGTFVSSDGGLSWREVSKGVNTYQIGDSGGLIVLVPFDSLTDRALFSYDYGKSFNSVQFTEKNQYRVSEIGPERLQDSYLLLFSFTFLYSCCLTPFLSFF